jgi:hypothetical protein
MIAVYELRVGNLVLVAGEVQAIAGIVQMPKGDVVFVTGQEMSVQVQDIEPVGLSNSLVQQCWFREAEDGFWWEHVTASIYLQKTNGRWDFSLTDPREVASWMPMYSLHQLQNLFFALSGAELDLDF